MYIRKKNKLYILYKQGEGGVRPYSYVKYITFKIIKSKMYK